MQNFERWRLSPRPPKQPPPNPPIANVWLRAWLLVMFKQKNKRLLSLTYFDVRFVTSDVIATGRKYRYRFATRGKLILLKLILLSSILVNNNVIVIENRQKNFKLQLQLWTFENFQLQLQHIRVINYNFVNYNYNFSKPDRRPI